MASRKTKSRVGKKSGRPARKKGRPAKKAAKKGKASRARSSKKPKPAKKGKASQARSSKKLKPANKPMASRSRAAARRSMAAPKTPKASIRRPVGAEELKAKIGALSAATGQIRGLKRSLNRSFYDIGQILREIEVKGYGSFEAFVEREIDLGKQLSLRIARIAQTFLKDAALAAGLERVSAALAALEGEEESSGSASSTSAGTRSAIPLHKQ